MGSILLPFTIPFELFDTHWRTTDKHIYGWNPSYEFVQQTDNVPPYSQTRATVDLSKQDAEEQTNEDTQQTNGVAPVAQTHVTADLSKQDVREPLQSPESASKVTDHERDPEERLQELEQLKKKGLMTDDEYAKKRKEILDSL